MKINPVQHAYVSRLTRNRSLINIGFCCLARQKSSSLGFGETLIRYSQRASIPSWLPHVQSRANFAQSTERRIRRWLGNPAIDPISIYGPLITRALQDWGDQPLVVALDTSVLFERFCLIRIAVLFRGRAVPLATRVIEHSSAQVGIAHLLPLLAEVKGTPDFLGLHEVRLLADRGFCDTQLMAWLHACNWHYRIRIKSNLILAAPDGRRLCKVGEIRLAARETRCFHNVTITGQHFGPVIVALGRPTDSLEQWQVVSDEPTSTETFTEYGERFQIEEGFLDDKSGLFALESSRIRDAAGLERLTLTLSVATLLLVSEGLQLVAAGARRAVDPHWTRALSYLKLGLRGMQYALSRGQAVFNRLTLVGGTDPESPGLRNPTRSTPLASMQVGWELIFRSFS